MTPSNPQSADFDALFESGIVYLRYMDWPNAARAFDHCIAIDPENGRARTNFAMALFRMGHIDEAQQHAERATSDRLARTFAHTLLSEVYGVQGDYRAAISAAQTALKFNPEEPIANHYLAQAFYMSGQPEKAIRPIRKAIRFARGWSPDLYVLEGDILRAIGKLAGALEKYEFVIGRADEPALQTVGIDAVASAWNGKGIVHLTKGLSGKGEHWPEAKAAFQNALEREPRLVKSWAGVAVANRHLNLFESALEAIDRAIALSRRDGYLLLERAMALYDLGRFSEALVEFEEVLTSQCDEATKRDALTWKPYALLRATKLVECIDAADKSIAAGVDNAHVRTARAAARPGPA